MSQAPSALDVLERCAASAGMEFDPVLVRRSAEAAKRDHPELDAETWAAQLRQAGQSAGFRVTPVRWTAKQVLATAAPRMPVVTFLPEATAGGEPAGGRWVVIDGQRGGKLRVAGLGPQGRDVYLTPGELARAVGAGSKGNPHVWAALQPIAPCDGVRDPNLDSHGHGHGHHEPISPISRLFGLMRPERRDIRVVIWYAVGVGVLSLATPLAIEALVNTVAKNLLFQQLVVLALILLFCLSMAAFFQTLQTFVVEIIQRRLFVRVAADLSYRLPRVKMEAYDGQNGVELVNRFFDVLTVQKVSALILLDGVTLVLQALIGLIVLGWYHPFLLGFDVVLLAMMCFIIFMLGRGAIATSIRESRAKYAVAGALEELARAPLAYKSPGGPDLAMARADAMTRVYLAARRQHFAIYFRQVIFGYGTAAIATSALLGLGGWLVIQEQLNFGQLVAAELIVALVVGSFTKMGKQLEGWYDLMAAMDKLGHLIDLPLERADGEAPAAPEPSGASLVLHHVGYTYDHHHEVLHGLDLEVKPGERVALVGPSGSGKSTLVDLLYGLRTPTAGSIRLDGMNVRDIRLDDLRREVAAIKALDILEGSIVENVRLGRPELTLDEVYRAIESVGLSEEVSALPDGMHTMLNHSGAPLSLGQAKRLMLARAIAGRPRLLVLDESLDALDLDSRRRVLEVLFDRQAPWTLLAVTHDQEVAARCDRTVALADGHAAHHTEMENGHSPKLEDWLKEVRPWRFS